MSLLAILLVLQLLVQQYAYHVALLSHFQTQLQLVLLTVLRSLVSDKPRTWFVEQLQSQLQ
jgi:hypothetical protein